MSSFIVVSNDSNISIFFEESEKMDWIEIDVWINQENNVCLTRLN